MDPKPVRTPDELTGFQITQSCKTFNCKSRPPSIIAENDFSVWSLAKVVSLLLKIHLTFLDPEMVAWIVHGVA